MLIRALFRLEVLSDSLALALAAEYRGTCGVACNSTACAGEVRDTVVGVAGYGCTTLKRDPMLPRPKTHPRFPMLFQGLYRQYPPAPNR